MIEGDISSPELIAKARETVKETPIEGVLVVERRTFPDGRGFFRETYRKIELETVLGRPVEFVQQNHSRNEAKGTLRGIHTAPWDKFIYVPSGRVQAVIVDFREDSPTFGKYFSMELGDSIDLGKPELANRAKVFVPKGCGNAYLVLSERVDYMYETTGYWAPNTEFEVSYRDPDLKIEWLADEEPILSERDLKAPSLRDRFPEKFR